MPTEGSSSSSSSAPSPFAFKTPAPPTTFAALKQRRVSLASQPPPRGPQGWNFRDDTGIDSNANAAASSSTSSAFLSAALVPVSPGSSSPRKGKIRAVDLSYNDLSDEPLSPVPEREREKKPRKKWTEEETNMLVKGCQIVSLDIPYPSYLLLRFTFSMALEIGR